MLFLPILLVVWGLTDRAPWGKPPRQHAGPLLGFLALLLVSAVTVNGLVFIWDGARQAPIGVWDQGYGDNTPGRFVRSDEIWPRAFAWLQLTSLALGPTWIALGGLTPAVWRLWRAPASAVTIRMLVLAGHGLATLCVYWLLAFNIWDRYVLPLAPLLAILAAYGVAGLRQPEGARPASPWVLRLPSFVLLAALVLAPSAWWASQSRYPLGGDMGAYDGLEQAAAYLRAQPAETVVYDHWLSWPWRFYLFESPAYVAWMADPQALERDLRAFGRSSPRFFVVPSWEAETEFRSAAERAGFSWTPVFTATRPDRSPAFRVVRLAPASP
jgi:hypothetical protein